jgi:hypothetical protein
MQAQPSCSSLQNCVYSAKLSGTIRYDNTQPFSQHLAYFTIGEDLTINSTGGDPFGQYVYNGTVTADGRISLVRKHYMNDHLPALFLQGVLNDDGGLSGVVTESVPPYGTIQRGVFEFTQMTHFWRGEYSESTGKQGPLELSFFMGPTIYGFGKVNGSVYTIKGSYEPFTHRVVLHEFNSNKAMNQRLFEGTYTPAGGKIQGMFKTPCGKSGTFSLAFCQEGFSSVPRMDVIEAQQVEIDEIKSAPPMQDSQPNYAKLPPLKRPGELVSTDAAQPPSAIALTDVQINAPNFSQLTQPQVASPGFGILPPSTAVPGINQPGMVWMMGPTAPVHIAPTIFSQALIQLTQRVSGVDKAACMQDLLDITQQIHQGKIVLVNDLLGFYGLCRDNKFKIALTQAVAGYVVGMNPVSFERAVSMNSSPEVQLTVIQAFGAGVRGQLAPDLKQRILKSIVFDLEKKIASAILSTL